MVTRQEFMSVGLTYCGSDRQTFSQLSKLWNQEKEALRQMTKEEVREALVCP
jgi:hypothetical protein